MGHDAIGYVDLHLLLPEAKILRSRLANEDARQRGMILRALANTPADRLRSVLPELVRTLRDPSDTVRMASLLVLQAMDGACTECLPTLLELVEDENAELVSASVHVLAQMGPRAEQAVPALIEHLHSPDEHLVDLAAAALGQIHARPDTVLPALMELMRAEGSDTAARAMGAYGPEGYACALEILRGHDPDARHAALLVFASQGEAAAAVVPELIPLIGGEDVFLEERAILTAEAIGPRAAAAVPAMMRALLRGPGPLNPSFVGRALRAIGPAGESALKEALRGSDKTHRLRALGALDAFRGRMSFALAEIDALLRAEDTEVRDAAQGALLVGLEYPDGFAQTPPGIDDRKLRERAREELVRMLKGEDCDGRLVVHEPRRCRQMLEALDKTRGR